MGADVNDYQNCVTPGGLLLSFYQVWLKNTCHPRVVHILQWGYKIILREPIKFSTVPITQSGYTNPEEQNCLQDCVTQMLKKKAVVPVRISKTGILQQVVLVPKPGKKWSIDLIVLNKHLSVPTFKMETAEVIRNTICKGEWVVSIDLTDTYFHIPIHPKSKHLLRFHVAGQPYQFRGLLFGIATAPLELTRVVKEVKLMLQNRGTVSRRLVTSGSIKRNMLATVKRTGCVCPRSWGTKLPEIRAKTYSKFRFSGVQVQLGQWRGLTHRKEMADLDKSHRSVTDQLDHKTQKSNVFHRDSGLSQKDSFSGQAAHETIPVVPENPLEVSPIFGHSDTMLRDFEKASELVEGSKNMC